MKDKEEVQQKIDLLRKRLRDSIKKKENGKKEDVASLIRQIQTLEAQS